MTSQSLLVPALVLLVEDELSFQLEMEMLLHEIGVEEVLIADNANDVLTLLQDRSPELIFMDIAIKGETDGIELARQLTDFNIPIIFMTSFASSETFQKVRNEGEWVYLIKPPDRFTLISTMNLLLERKQKTEFTEKESERQTAPILREGNIYIRKNSKYYQIPVQEIYYVEVSGDYCISFCQNRQFINRMTMLAMKELLHEWNFIQSHRSYLVNLSHVKSLDLGKNKIILLNGKELPLSRSNRKLLQQELAMIK